MTFLDYDKVLVQLWLAEKQSIAMRKILEQSGKLISELPSDSFLWTGTAEELRALLTKIETVQHVTTDSVTNICPSETTA